MSCDGERETRPRGIASPLSDQRGSSLVQELILVSSIGLLGVAGFRALRDEIDDSARCAGQLIASLRGGGQTSCAESGALGGGDGRTAESNPSAPPPARAGTGRNGNSAGGDQDQGFEAELDRVRDQQALAQRQTSRAGSSIRIQGSPEFTAATEAALDVVRSTAPGRAMLEEIDRSGKDVVIQMSTERDGSAVGRNEDNGYLREDGTRGPGTDSTIFWDPTYEGPDEPGGETFPPYTVFAHELVHAFNLATGSMADSERGPVSAEENQAVGLPFDHDDNPSTPDITPEQFYRQLGLPNVSENAIRGALGLPLKTEY